MCRFLLLFRSKSFLINTLFGLCWVLLLACFLVANSPKHCEGRTWEGKSGRTLEAELIEVRENHVILRKRDGKKIKVRIDRFSEKDQSFFRAELKDNGGSQSPTSSTRDGRSIDNLEQLHEFVKNARKAKDILAAYKRFLDNPNASSADKNRAKAGIPRWERLAAEDAVKVGREFVPAAVIKERKERAVLLVKEARELLVEGVDEPAHDRLKEASKIDPDAVSADLMMGVVWMVFKHQKDKAAKHFKTAVGRSRRQAGLLTNLGEANYVTALNNLALINVRQNKLESAYRHWKTLVELQPQPPAEVIQNIGRVRALVLAGQGKRSPAYPNASKSLTKRFDSMYSNLSLSQKSYPFEPRTGWLYMPPVVVGPSENTPEKKPPVVPPSKDKAMRRVGCGSGFVVAPGYVLTNRHVVVLNEGSSPTICDGFRLQQASSLGTRHVGTVAAISEEHDLALIRCHGLEAVPIAIRTTPPKTAEDIMVFGFPRPDTLGYRFTATKGVVSSLPNSNVKEVLYDATTNAGNSGGPTLGKRGNAVAVHSIAFGINFSKSYAGGVQCTDVLPFLNKHIAGYQAKERKDEPADWATLTESVKEAVIAIECMVIPARLTGVTDSFSDKKQKKKSWKALEDPWCMVCGGLEHRECPIRKCMRGGIRKYKKTVLKDPLTGTEIIQRTPIRVPCSNCDGKGRVDCEYCIKGIDRSLSR